MPPSTLRSLDELPAVCEGVSRRNFYADMLAGVHPCQRGRHMPLPGRGYVYEINIVALDQFLKSALPLEIECRSILACLLDHRLSLQDLFLHNVAEGGHLHPRYI